MVRLTAKLKSALKTIKKRKAQKHPLTPMPRLLMHWWTPLILAIILLATSCFIASVWHSPLSKETLSTINILKPSTWPFVYHWPSAEAMKLCITISGAGLAFAAWQQKHHDNAYNNNQAIVAAEREDYWKRREQIYQLLGSKNPGLRLSAVALLAELADQAANSTFLNEIEKQQLQRHIIDTLCLQLRHEGLALDNEGNESEHAEIQAAIFTTILTRIDIRNNLSPYADWSREPINITSCIVHTPLLIQNLTTHTTIDFSQTEFRSTFTLSNATITSLLWERAYFIGELTTQDNSIIGIRSLPLVAPYSRYIDTSFMHESETFMITLMTYKNDTTEPRMSISKCKFTTKSTKCTTPIEIYTRYDESDEQEVVAQNLDIYRCHLADITIDATYINSHISIAENSITGHLQIDFTESANEDGLLERIPHAHDRILIRNNFILPEEDDDPIRITNYTDTKITNLISLHNNLILRANDFGVPHILKCKIDAENPKPFKFIEHTSEGQITHTWQTGGGDEDFELFSDSIFIASPKDKTFD